MEEEEEEEEEEVWLSEQTITFALLFKITNTMSLVFISRVLRHLVADFRVFWHCVLFPFMRMFTYVGFRWFCLHVLLYQIAAFVLYSFLLMLLY